jgi:hypothetical protein
VSEPLRGYLRRRIEKFERPKSLFGKFPYTFEQGRVAKATDSLYGAVISYRPDTTLGLEIPFRRILPKKTRENKIKKAVQIAYKNLKEIT